MRLEHRVILALDTPSVERARGIVDKVHDTVDGVKVGWPLLLAGGLSTIRELSRFAYVLADLKVADIPSTNRHIVGQVVDAGASGVVCHAFAGEDSVRACKEATGSAELFVVTEMSHPGGAEFTAPHAESFARLAVRIGAAGIIAPATRPERLRVLRDLVGSRIILSPGVGAQGGRVRDAIANGADAVIVGRSILEAADPLVAAKEIAREATGGRVTR